MTINPTVSCRSWHAADCNTDCYTTCNTDLCRSNISSPYPPDANIALVALKTMMKWCANLDLCRTVLLITAYANSHNFQVFQRGWAVTKTS